MYYRVEVYGSIDGNLLQNSQYPYEYYGIRSVETLDREYKSNIIYRSENQFSFHIYLDNPSSKEIIEAKNLIREKMLQELNKILENLQNIKEQLNNPIQFE